MCFLVPNDVALQRIDAAGHPFGAFLGSPRTGSFHGETLARSGRVALGGHHVQITQQSGGIPRSLCATETVPLFDPGMVLRDLMDLGHEEIKAVPRDVSHPNMFPGLSGASVAVAVSRYIARYERSSRWPCHWILQSLILSRSMPVADTASQVRPV